MAKVKHKEEDLRSRKEKQIVTYKGASIGLLDAFSTDTFQASKD